MIAERVSLNVPATATTGTPSSDILVFIDKWVQLAGVAAASATVRIEGTIDGTNYVALAIDSSGTLNITVDGIFAVDANLFKARINRTVAGSGAAITATMSVRNSRSE